MAEACPMPERWKEHLDGTLPADEQAQLTEHLDSCADCRKTIETIAAGSDSLLDVARDVGEATDASSPGLHDVVAKFAQVSQETQAEAPAVRDDSLTFLTPSTRPGSKGRLRHYEIQETIGRGGFGIVLKAFDEKLHRVVAIKVLSPSYAAVGSARARFIREARSAAAVKNEHVVAIYDVQDDADPPYLVMELIDGISLQDKLDKKGPLSVKEILRIGMQTAEGLAAAHKQGLVHRDIKPANILLENGVERVKITDFGLARAVDDASVTQSGTVAGTPMYMSPEQAEGLPIDHRSDLFSLGTVLYAMCTGHPPFRASGTHAVLKRVIDASPRPIREVSNEIPGWLADIIAKLHAKNPADRFQTAKEVAELLGQRLADVQAGRVIERAGSVSDGPATPAKTVAYSSGSSRRRRIVYAALAFVALAATALTVTELTDVTQFFHTPHYWINLGVDDPNITISIWRVKPGETEPDLTAGGDGKGLLMFQHKGERQVSLAAGDYWFLARRDDRKVVYYERVTVDRSRAVVINWAAAVARRNEGWVQLFNGRNLDGWRSPQSSWKIEDGNLKGTGDLIHEREFDNFHLRLEGKIETEPKQFGNTFATGVQVRTKANKGGVEAAYRAAIRHDKQGFTTSFGRYLEGGLVESLEENKENLVRTDQWFVMEVIAVGKKLTVKVNNVVVADTTDTHHLRGQIALFAHDKVRYKTVEIKSLPDPSAVGPGGWVQLFNGKEAHGLILGAWQIDKKTGLLLGNGPGQTYAFTERDDYADFHLKAECVWAGNTESAIFFRCGKELLKGELPAGYQVVAGTRQNLNPFALQLTTADSPKPVLLQNASSRAPAGGDFLYPLEIIARGNRIEIKYDGKTIVDYSDDKATHRKGRIALQVSSPDAGGVLFKKLEIKELPPEEPGWVQLFNDKDLDGWKVAMGKKEAWSVKDNAIVGSGTHNYLVTEKSAYRDFHLRAKVKISDKGDSGILFRGAFGSTDGMVQGQILNWADQNGTGSVFRETTPLISVPSPDITANTWFDFEIIAQGSRIETRINGKSAAVTEDIKKSPGPIGLESANENTVVHFKKIEIKELPPEEPGWVQLFNGKDLTGWNSHPTQPSRWKVEDGKLVGTGTSRSHLFTERGDYADFQLRAECQISPKGEGGVFLRCKYGLDRIRWGGAWTEPDGYEVGIDNDPRLRTGNLYGPGDNEALLKASTYETTKPDTWFVLDIVARGSWVSVQIDGKQVLEYDDPRRLYAKGHIALEVGHHDSVIRFRKIAIKELPREEPGWVQLFNGKDLTGWHKHPSQPGNWRVEDGALTASGPGTHSHLFSDRGDYENFHLRAEVRINFFRDKEKVAFGNSGIYFRAGKKLDLDAFNRYPKGYEAQIFAGEATPSGEKERNRTGSLYGHKPYEKIIKGADAGDWFTIEIIARGPRITVKVNGLTTVDDFHDPTYSRGHLALQQAGAGTIVHFKKIEIKELPPP